MHLEQVIEEFTPYNAGASCGVGSPQWSPFEGQAVFGASVWRQDRRFEGMNEVVGWPGATQEQLDGLLRAEVASGLAKGFDITAGHEEIKGEQLVPGRVGKFHLVPDEEAGQGAANLVHQKALVQG